MKKQFEDRVRLGSLFGYDRRNSYRVHIPDERKILVSRDVKCDEKMQKVPTSLEWSVTDAQGSSDEAQKYEEQGEDSSNRSKSIADEPHSSVSEAMTEDVTRAKITEGKSSSPTELTYYPQIMRSSRERSEPSRYTPNCSVDVSLQTNAGYYAPDTPNSF